MGEKIVFFLYQAHLHQDNAHKHIRTPLDYIVANKLVRKIQMSCIKPIKERKIKPQKGLKFYLTKEKGMKEENNKLLHSSVSFVFLCLVFES